MEENSPNKKRFTYHLTNETLLIVAAFLAIAIVLAAFIITLAQF